MKTTFNTTSVVCMISAAIAAGLALSQAASTGGCVDSTENITGADISSCEGRSLCTYKILTPTQEKCKFGQQGDAVTLKNCKTEDRYFTAQEHESDCVNGECDMANGEAIDDPAIESTLRPQAVLDSCPLA
jgi:hypothetical protein